MRVGRKGYKDGSHLPRCWFRWMLLLVASRAVSCASEAKAETMSSVRREVVSPLPSSLCCWKVFDVGSDGVAESVKLCPDDVADFVKLSPYPPSNTRLAGWLLTFLWYVGVAWCWLREKKNHNNERDKSGQTTEYLPGECPVRNRRDEHDELQEIKGRWPTG